MYELLGRHCAFIPHCMLVKWMRSDGMSAVTSVRGMIEYVNAEHGWFRVRWYAGGTEQHECFKECDIGTVVTLVGRC